MNKREVLLGFEEKYRFLYELESNGFPVYLCLRESVSGRLYSGTIENTAAGTKKREPINIKRIIDSFLGLIRNRRAKTLIFTSSVYRRDKGRNLAVEWLTDRYPDAVVFEWPSRIAEYDELYSDDTKCNYCPIDLYILILKMYLATHKKKVAGLKEYALNMIKTQLAKCEKTDCANEQGALDYLIENLPEVYAMISVSQTIFRRIFRKYKNLEYAIDFWGGARENIIPVLPSEPESIELQHGLINSAHPGYIYPKFVADYNYSFFKRKILVYGDKTKNMLCDLSIFEPQQLEVIGNPRIKKYKEEISVDTTDKKLILFASQTYEQDGTGTDYYATIIPVLQKIAHHIKTDERFALYKLGVKLHPRENNSIVEMYQKALPDAQVFGNTSQLYELLASSYVQLTVSSTTLFEAAEFGTPTVLVAYGGVRDIDMFGFKVKSIDGASDVCDKLAPLLDTDKYSEYLDYLIENTQKNL